MLQIRDLTRGRGDTYALRGFSFDAADKGVYGILGAHGSGKTALARLICGVENADGGEILVRGELMSASAMEQRKKVRCAPSELALYPTSSAEEHLDFVGGALGVAPDKRYRQIKEALELTGLSDRRGRAFSRLSPLEKCRLAICAALLGNPDIIVLDDALAALKSEEKKEIYPLLQMLGGIKTLILLTSDPTDIRAVCQSVSVLHGGRSVISGTVEEIEKKINATAQLYVTVRGEAGSVLEAVEKVDGVVSARLHDEQTDGICIVSVEHLPDSMIKDKIFTALAAISAPMLSTKAVMLTLEDLFYSFAAMEKNKDRDAAIKNRNGGND